MAETPYLKFRLGEQTLAQLDELAGSAGSRAQALREAVAYWRLIVSEAARQNSEELSEDDWVRLAHLNDPDPVGLRDEDERSLARDWSARLAMELVGMWEGRDLSLPMHREESQACRALARRVAGLGMVRGYALMAALRAFWRRQGSPERWWRPEAWLTAGEREGG